MLIEKVYFNTNDNLRLYGLLHKPEMKTEKVIVSIHGMSNNCFSILDNIIANECTKNGLSYFAFNNRGAEYASKFRKSVDRNEEKLKGGCIYENILDSKYDVKAAINTMLEKGYTDIYLMGHSLGSTKSIYTYNELIKNINDPRDKRILDSIKSVILLSLIDVQGTQRFYLNEKFDEVMNLAESLIAKDRGDDLMPDKSNIYPLCAREYVQLFKDNELINFAQYSNKEYDFKEINNIKVPVFMRWGNVNELLLQKIEDLIELLKIKINNDRLDIGYVDGANHNYSGKEEILAKEIITFINKN